MIPRRCGALTVWHVEVIPHRRLPKREWRGTGSLCLGLITEDVHGSALAPLDMRRNAERLGNVDIR
jgi:hypothetical protein